MARLPLCLHITSIPPGDAPEWVRREWVGLSLPLATKTTSARSYSTVSVLQRPQRFLDRCLDWLKGKQKRVAGYPVETVKAIEILESSHLEAAAWWRQNTPHLLNPGQYFLFPESVGTVME